MYTWSWHDVLYVHMKFLHKIMPPWTNTISESLLAKTMLVIMVRGLFTSHSTRTLSFLAWSLVETKFLIPSGKWSIELSATLWKSLQQLLSVHLQIGDSLNYMASHSLPTPLFCIRCPTRMPIMGTCCSSFPIHPNFWRRQETAGLRKQDYSGYVCLNLVKVFCTSPILSTSYRTVVNGLPGTTWRICILGIVGRKETSRVSPWFLSSNMSISTSPLSHECGLTLLHRWLF